MHPSHYAKTHADKAAVIMGNSGEVLTFAQLESRSNQIAHLFRSLGIAAGDHVAILMDNNIHFMSIVYGAQRAGLVYTAVSTHLLRDEVAYIAENCEARVMFTNKRLLGVATQAIAQASNVEHLFVVDADIDEPNSLAAMLAAQPTTPIADEQAGTQMLYSSGTTGRPKGVLQIREGVTPIDSPNPMALALVQAFGVGVESVYLSPAPLYHAAPLTFNTIALALGATCVVMEKFDPENALALIERYAVTHSQWVPIMFVRMLKLPEELKSRYDLSSLQVAVHAAAPCPVPIKHQMIEWWGPRIAEYYASTEGAGFTAVDSANWLTHPGTVGQPRSCNVHILGEDGEELPTGEVGTVYFSGGALNFAYYHEDEKTKGAYNPKGWATVGDVGYMDEDGFLYLTDRKHYMIISGGVNIYPQEVEDLLISHPAVADAAVFGLPDPEFGEKVHAVVEPLAGEQAGDELRDTLMSYCRERLSHIKIPKAIDFDPALPRMDNGKLYKRRLVDAYLKKAGA